MARAGVIDELRRRTELLHRRLERRLLAPPGLGNAERYSTYLSCMLGLTRALSAAVAREQGVEQILPDVSARLAQDAALEGDLADLGASGTGVALPALSELRSEAELMGALYVMEGSKLGGVVLARELGASAPELPTRYLKCYGAELQARWRAFCAALEGFAGTPERREGVCQGAERMFASVERWLEAGGLLTSD